MILSVNKKQLAEDVQAILEYSQDYPFELNHCDKLIEQWYKAKKPFIEMFNGELTIKHPTLIKVRLSQEERSRRFNDFISTLEDTGYLTIDLEKFFRDNEKGFYDNKVLTDFPQYNVTQGMKLSKSLKKILADRDTVRKVQDTASQYIQEDKIEGYLYFSIDPRDFLSLSENNFNWWSCQSLDGDYRAGNLSYMVDKTTIIAYLATDKKTYLKSFPYHLSWNSKKWRMLIHTDLKNIIYYNRQYPYSSNVLLEKVHNFMRIQCLNCSTTWTEPTDYGIKTTGTYNQICLGGRVYDMRDILDTKNYMGFSDLISSPTYSPIVSLNQDWLVSYLERNFANNFTLNQELEYIKEIFNLPIGEKPVCVCCGEEHVYRADTFLCLTCIAENDADENFYLSCGYCGRRIYPEDKHLITEDNTVYCGRCATREEFKEFG